MINRRRLRKADPLDMNTDRIRQSTDLQRALRLGWAIAETFGRLRAYQPDFANKRNDPNQMPRFSYSNSDLSGIQRLEVSCRQLMELASALDVPLPHLPDLTNTLLDGSPLRLDDSSLRRVYDGLETWSRSTWIQLNVRSAALGRAMTYGGSLADTYWYMAQPGTAAFLEGRQSVEALLRSHRLRRMQERMNEISEAFSPAACDAIGHSLSAWMYDEYKAVWATAAEWQHVGVVLPHAPRRTPPQQLHFNLFRQVRTWHDLLFESRQPLDYVSPGFRRRANLAAGTITILLVVLVAIGVGLLIFSLLRLALGVVGSRVEPSSGEELIEAISVFVSLLSTLAIVTAGLLSRASTAVQQFDAWLETAMVRRSIRQKTVVPWNDPPHARSD